MRVLHYSLGPPPYRDGGIMKYSMDLMAEQAKDKNNSITLLYPGQVSLFSKSKIIRGKDLNAIHIFEIRNPVYVPLLSGIRNPKCILNPSRKLSTHAIYDFLTEINPEIIHIHTFMGIQKEFIFCAKRLNIKILLTTHDYFGLCPKVSFIDWRGEICEGAEGTKCALCNYAAPGKLPYYLNSQKIIHRHKYKFRTLKNLSSSFFNIIKGNDANAIPKTISPAIKESYNSLITHYRELIASVDFIHFNSEISKAQYLRFIPNLKGEVIPITHNGIQDNRILKQFDQNNIQLLFIGDVSPFKGFILLKEALQELIKNNFDNWSLSVYGNKQPVNTEISKIHLHGTYTYDQLKTIMQKSDLLIVPSIWKETFSLTALEALSFGVPCLVSENVGARELVKSYNPLFVFSLSKAELASRLKMILKNPNLLSEYNERICRNNFNHSIKAHSFAIMQMYKKL